MFFLSPHLGNMTMQTPRIGILHIFFLGGGGGGGGVRCFFISASWEHDHANPENWNFAYMSFYTQLGKNKRAAVGMHHTLPRNIFNTKTN